MYRDDPSDPFPLDVTGRDHLKFLAVPVLARFAVGGAGLHVLTGPSINVSLGGRLNGERLDVGFVIGGGFYGGLLTVEGRYEEGLKGTRPSFANAGAMRNRALLLLFGIRR